MQSECACTPKCSQVDDRIDESTTLQTKSNRPSPCRIITAPVCRPSSQRPHRPTRPRSISTGQSLPCLTSNEASTRACTPAPLRPSTAPPETYPDIPERYLPHLFLIGTGQSGMIHLLTPTTVLKLPMEDHLIDLENERDIYTRISVFKHPSMLHFLGTLHTGIVLSYHPIGALRMFIHGAADSGLGVTDEHIQQLTQHRMKWAQQIAEGVEFLHQNGIVHCDTSSANTLITSSYDVVLCDFSSSMMDGVAKGGKTRCSRWYKFVEDEDDDTFGEGRQYTIQDDLWAVGTVCYEMWARKRLWGSFPDGERVLLYKQDKWPCLEGVGHIGNVIAKCWVDLYGCAGELLTDISQVAESEKSQEKKVNVASEDEQECIAWDAVD
ncbi:kinase-like domain-containing protein [Cadophora sp. MPI-SDFR-AT-0126]|nr:kinase-like domain-containing protein [Leotiomycetes sp. MPI-SDFR-AT-0126]